MTEQRDAPTMRILLAHDLSLAADLAVDLLRGASWPSSTVVRVISSPVGVGPALSSFANLREARANARQVRETIAVAHERVAADLRRAGLAVETAPVPGEPERAIVAEAERFGADLVVMGARRQGSIAATLLGSVSRAVVESATCSVLVARSAAIGQVLLATDGSPPAQFATALVGSWPLFEDASIRIVGVGEAPPRSPGAIIGDRDARLAYGDTIAASADEAGLVVREAAEKLAARGRRVTSAIRVGDVPTEVVAAAEEWPADLVVVGSNAQPLLQRLVLGSVARKVLDGVTSSVLIARPGLVSDDSRATEPTPP